MGYEIKIAAMQWHLQNLIDMNLITFKYLKAISETIRSFLALFAYTCFRVCLYLQSL